MLDLKTRPISLISNWDLVREILATYGPEKVHKMRKAALERFEELGIPTTKHEEFKYLSLRALEEVEWKPAYGAVVDRFELSSVPLGELDAITVAFVNGEYAPELSSAHFLPDGVFIGPLRDAWDICRDVVDQHLTR